MAPAKIFIDEGVYYAAVYTDVGSAAPKDKKAYVSKDKTIDKANGKPRICGAALAVSKRQDCQAHQADHIRTCR